MTEVVFQNRKQVVILEYVSYPTPEELIKSAFGGAPQGATVGPLRWVDGILLSFSALPPTETVVKELMEGRLYWDHLSFTPMPTYQPTIYVRERALTCTIVDVSRHPVFKQVAQAIKERFLKGLT